MAHADRNRGALASEFIVPPFNVISAREGFWRERKRLWRRLGVMDTTTRADLHKSLGRGVYGREVADWITSSIFDPVLTELLYSWFCPPGGHVFDPFAGGPVRGVVAALYGLRYSGIELRGEQIAVNQAIGGRLGLTPSPDWIEGDSLDTASLIPRSSADFLFSCPPYGDLERYSADPRDLSNMPWDGFLGTYREIIQHSAEVLRPDRFACFVVGEFRDRRGFCRGFVSETVRAFEAAGLHLYNHAVLLTPLGTVPVRARLPFRAARKLASAHQNILVFVKGDPKLATQHLGEVRLIDLPSPPAQEAA